MQRPVDPVGYWSVSVHILCFLLHLLPLSISFLAFGRQCGFSKSYITSPWLFYKMHNLM